jgi:hypothetical protein
MFVPSCRVCTASWQLAGRKTWDMWLVELDKGAGSDLKRASERVLEPTDRWCVCVCIRARGNPASRSDLPLVLCCAVLCFAFASSDLNQPSRTPHTASHRVPAGGCNRHEPIVPKVSNLPCEPPGEMPSASPVDTAITPKLLIIAPRRTLRACWACSACLMEPFTESLSSLDATRHY